MEQEYKKQWLTQHFTECLNSSIENKELKIKIKDTVK